MFLRCFPLSILLTLSSSYTYANTNIDVGSSRIIILTLGRKFVITTDQIPSGTNYLYIQVHTQYRNVTLSSTSTRAYGSAVTGHNVGLLSKVRKFPFRRSMQWFLFYGYAKNSTALVHLTALQYSDPIPGGCNMVFPLPNDPNSLINNKDHVTTLTYQWANAGTQPPQSCDLPLTNRLSYSIYVKYLPPNDFSENTYINALKQFLTPDLTSEYGQMVQTTSRSSITQSRFSFTTIHGQGMLMVVVVKDLVSGQSASYVPKVTYNCNLEDITFDCSISHNVAGQVLTVVGLLIGLFLSFLGHRFFKVELVCFGLLAIALLCVILTLRYTYWSQAVILGVSSACGLVAGFIWVALWWWFESPKFSVILPALVGGYLFASLLFVTPFGNLSVWKNSINYGVTFSVSVLLFPLVMIAFPKRLNILACTFVGSYLSLLVIDYNLYGSLRYFLLSSIYRAAYPHYFDAYFTKPYKITDIALCVVWPILFIVSCVFQLVREDKRDDFQRRRHNRRGTNAQVLDHYPVHPTASERTPLLQPTNHLQPGGPQSQLIPPQSTYVMPTAPPPPSYV